MSQPPAKSRQGRRVMISCGEASGDLYAGALVTELRALDPAVAVFGFGGPRLAATGARLLADYRRFSVTGLVEAASVLGRSLKLIRALGDEAPTTRPDVFVAIDFPDFNFRLLPLVHAAGVPVVYYVSPQVWAWRKGRLETMRRYVEKTLVIFPFETAIYEKASMPVQFVGHPLIDLAKSSRTKAQWLGGLGLDSSQPVVALLPGSRANELRRILPILARAIPTIAGRISHVQFVVARAPALEDRLFAPLDAFRASSIPVRVVENATDDALASADIAVAASGTATIQAALHGCPMVIVYRLSPMTHALVRQVVKLETVGMVNLVAGRAIVPELIQKHLTPEGVAREVITLWMDPERRARMRTDLADVRERLGGGGASSRAARAVVDVADARVVLK